MIRKVQRCMNWLTQDFVAWVLVTVSVVSIVEDNYFTGNCVTTRGTSMQSGFLCACSKETRCKICKKSMPETPRFISTKYRKSNSIRCNKSATYHVDQSNAKHGCSRAMKSKIRSNDAV